MSLRADAGDGNSAFDGAWFPRSRDLAAELPELIAELDRRGVRVERFTYAARRLARRSPRKLVVTRPDRAHRRLPQHGPRCVVCLTWDGGARRADLLVVPPETDVLTGARALRLCTRRGLPRSPQMVLAAARSDAVAAGPRPAAPPGRLNSARREPAGRRGSGSAEVRAMRLLVLGGTHFLGRHVATAALERGHDVATFTRGVSGDPPEGARALHGDRNDPDALPAALDGWAPELVVDTSCQTRAAARNAAAVLGGVRGYAFVSSLNAYAQLAARPDRPRGRRADLDHRRRRVRPEQGLRASAILGAVLGDRFLTARAGLIVGPHDPIYRLGWWLDRIARGGRVVVPGCARPADRRRRRPRPRRLAGRGRRARPVGAGSTPPGRPA